MLVTYLFFLVFGLFFTRTFFKLQTDSEEIIELGVQYLSICLIFSVGVLEQVVLERILQGTGKTIYTMITQGAGAVINIIPVSYTHLRAHETGRNLVCRLLLEKKKIKKKKYIKKKKKTKTKIY